ncbi:MAG: hypothetical protein ACE5PO_05280 [Candidatus Bathyarchaeia archaeon]
MNLTARIRESAMSNGMNLVGVSPVERLSKAPVGRKPRDLLPSARSVVSLSVKIPEGALAANRRAYSGVRHAIYVYMLYGYTLLNEKLNTAALQVTRLLEGEGHAAMPIPASGPMDYEALMGAVSHRHAAVAAGLGEFGWNGLLMTPEWGPHVRLVTVLTDAPLEYSPMYGGDRICDPERCKHLCSELCPVGAFGDTSDRVEIGDRTFEYAKMDHYKCYCGVEGLTAKTLALQPQELPAVMGSKEALNALSKGDPWQRKEMASGGSYCGRCLVHCPAGFSGNRAVQG